MTFSTDPVLIILQGALTWIFTAISGVLGGLMLYKYYKYRDKQLILVGMTWMLITSPWWGDALTFIYYMFTTNVLPNETYFFLANAFIAPIFYMWPKTVSELVFVDQKQKLKKIIRNILVLWAIIFEIVFLIIFFYDYRLLGRRIDYYIVDWNWYVNTYLLSGSVFLVITGMVFSYTAIKSEKLHIKLKGWFLLGAFVVFTLATFLEILFTDVLAVIIIARILGITSAICFYIGFVLPKFVKKIFKIV
ncbi:MAG: hypothetical protein JW891_02220 [Candidatus Lokiarchaeota archaeon]|nr:hypothetical protein [Candidatus Lokiarchaeota archaeon]